MRNSGNRTGIPARGDARNRNSRPRPSAFQPRTDFTAKFSACALGAAFLASPHAAFAADTTFDNASQFESKLNGILGSTGANTLTYTGANAPMTIDGTVVAPGTSSSLLINLGQKLTVGSSADASLTIGNGTTLNIGGSGTPTIDIGANGNEGALHIDGGVVNIFKSGSIAAMRIGYNAGQSGSLSITNGGVLNIGVGDGASYSQFFAGYGSGSEGDILLDNGRINFGTGGATIRLGLGGTSTLTMTNGSVLDSSAGSSHFRIGEWGTATVNVDNSTIIIDGTNSADKDRFFVIGHDGGTGVMNQTGADSLVKVTGIGAIGIGEGNGSHGTYNLNGGRLEIGTDASKNSFRVGQTYWSSESASTAIFNVNGGTADIKGNLEIGNAGSNGKFATGTVNLNSGLIDVGGKVVFGKGVGTLNLNGGVLELGGTNAITGSATSTINAAGGTLRAGSNLTVTHAATLGTGGITFDSNGYSMTYGGVLSGTGGVTKVGEGTLLLTGASTYVGDTVIRGGILETGHGTALGNGGAIVLDGGTLKLSTMVTFDGLLTSGENGGIVDLASQNVSWSGSSDGVGTIKFINGIVTLTGTLGSSGDTVLEDAQLVAGANNQLGSGSTLVLGDTGSFDNGTFTQSVAGLSGTGTINNNGTIDVGGTGQPSSFGGTLTGTGTLQKSGTGRFEITGSGSFSGTLGANGGILSMNGNYGNANVNIGSGGTLGGSGTIGSVSGEAGGVLAPGNSIDTLTVVGDANYNGLTYEVEINAAGASDKTAVGGTAYLGGGSLSILAEPGAYTNGTQYTIITAAKVDGKFNSVLDNLAFFDAIMNYQSDEVSFMLERNGLALADLANTRNQRTTAGGVESLGEANAIYDAVLQLSDSGVRTATDALSGEIHATAKTALIEDARYVRDTANDRIRAAFGGEAGTQGWTRIYGAWGSSGATATRDRPTARSAA